MCLSNLQAGEPKSVARIVPCIGTGQQLHPHSNATHRVFPALMALNVGKPLEEEFAAQRSRHRDIYLVSQLSKSLESRQRKSHPRPATSWNQPQDGPAAGR